MKYLIVQKDERGLRRDTKWSRYKKRKKRSRPEVETASQPVIAAQGVREVPHRARVSRVSRGHRSPATETTGAERMTPPGLAWRWVAV